MPSEEAMIASEIPGFDRYGAEYHVNSGGTDKWV
jgi:hypothetical protein